METIQSPGQQVPSFLVPPHSKAFLFSVVCCLVVCAIHGRAQNLSKASFPTRSPGNHIILFRHCGIGIGEEREDKKLPKISSFFPNQRDKPSCFPDGRESILPYPPPPLLSLSLPLLLTSGMTSLEGNILGTTEKMCRTLGPSASTKWPENGRMQKERGSERGRGCLCVQLSLGSALSVSLSGWKLLSPRRRGSRSLRTKYAENAKRWEQHWGSEGSASA